MVTSEQGEAKEIFAPVAKSSIPQGTKKVMFLVIPFDGKTATSRTRYSIRAMDDSQNAFPKGSFRFVNFTKIPLQVVLSGKGKKLDSGSMTVMKCQPRKGGGFEPMLINNTGGKMLYGNRLFGQPSGRELVFIIPPRAKGTMPRVKFVAQLLPANPPAPATASADLKLF